MTPIGPIFNYQVFHSQARASDAFRSTDLPLPRFVTLKSHKAFVRKGPGKQYPIDWVFQRKGLPVEIILEFENWRKIKDVQGSEGWVHQSLLSGRRSVITQSSVSFLYARPDTESRKLAQLEGNVIASLDKCQETFCQIEIGSYEGWAERSGLWGVYEDEEFR